MRESKEQLLLPVLFIKLKQMCYRLSMKQMLLKPSSCIVGGDFLLLLPKKKHILSLKEEERLSVSHQ